LRIFEEPLRIFEESLRILEELLRILEEPLRILKSRHPALDAGSSTHVQNKIMGRCLKIEVSATLLLREGGELNSLTSC